MTTQTFFDLIRPFLTSVPLRLGNVEFSKDEQGRVIYSLPANQWNCTSISNDITNLLEQTGALKP